jgi:mannose-6-phosphate isomerase-like protein (cupin superfamily)
MIINDCEGRELCLVVKKSERPKYANALSFFSSKEHPLQVGMWCNYTKERQLRTHRHDHNSSDTVVGFNEMFYVESGRVLVYIYDNLDRPWTKVELEPGDILIQLSGGHGFDVLEDGTSVLEVKSGPYTENKTVLDLKKW